MIDKCAYQALAIQIDAKASSIPLHSSVKGSERIVVPVTVLRATILFCVNWGSKGSIINVTI